MKTTPVYVFGILTAHHLGVLRDAIKALGMVAVLNAPQGQQVQTALAQIGGTYLESETWQQLLADYQNAQHFVDICDEEVELGDSLYEKVIQMDLSNLRIAVDLVNRFIDVMEHSDIRLYCDCN